MQDDLCYRYTGLKVRNIQKKVSPVDMRIRLFYCGSRGINLLADFTNYLMLEMGQPMHAFDCAKVGQIEVKRFEAPSRLHQPWTGRSAPWTRIPLMICCKGQPVAIAGIMGGLDSEIEDDTDSLLLEAPISTQSACGNLPPGWACAPTLLCAMRRPWTRR